MIADMHCDLLLYLDKNLNRSPFNPQVRCSIPQMREGDVKLQVLAIFAMTKSGSTEVGTRQNRIFHSLPMQFPKEYVVVSDTGHISAIKGPIGIIRSIENGSAFCEEEEPLQQGLDRLNTMMKEGNIVYISLTWNNKNRFGGGNATNEGITNDGKALLDFMSGRRVAVDLSHTSDTLAYDILDHIDRHGLHIPVIASHSNARAVMDVPRNLPDGLIKEVIRRKGIIGLNFIKPFLGPSNPDSICLHLEHLLKLGGESCICFGGDFFYEEDIPPELRRKPGEYFFNGFDSSACYATVLKKWQQEVGVSDAFIEAVSYRTVANFLTKEIL